MVERYPRPEVLSSVIDDAMGTSLVRGYRCYTGAHRMPTRYVIDKERRLIISTGWNRISCAEILAHRNQLRNDPDFDPSYNQLVDGRAVTGLNLSLNQAKAIASDTPFSPTSRRALVATDLEVLGIARMAEAYSGAERGREEVRVFHDFSAALAWLGVELESESV